jgi:molybdenum cofactor biosynthesis enzyme
MMEIQIQTTEKDVLKLIEQYQPATFRDLMIMLPDSIDAQSVWDTLRSLQKAMIIESVRISNKKSGYKIQCWYAKEI